MGTDVAPVQGALHLCLGVGSVRVALAADRVVEVLRAVALSPLPGAPGPVEGLLDLRGRPVPVLDLRRRLSEPPRPVRLSDRLVVVRARGREVAVRVDTAEDLVPLAPSGLAPLAAAPHLAGVARTEDGLLVVVDPDAFLAAAEADALAAALAAREGA